MKSHTLWYLLPLVLSGCTANPSTTPVAVTNAPLQAKKDARPHAEPPMTNLCSGLERSIEASVQLTAFHHDDDGVWFEAEPEISNHLGGAAQARFSMRVLDDTRQVIGKEFVSEKISLLKDAVESKVTVRSPNLPGDGFYHVELTVVAVKGDADSATVVHLYLHVRSGQFEILDDAAWHRQSRAMNEIEKEVVP